MKIRCVVTGHDARGKSVVARDADVEPVTLGSMPGYEFHRLWASESVPKLPSDGTQPPHGRYFPSQGGFRFAFFVVPPGGRRSAERSTRIGFATARVERAERPKQVDSAAAGAEQIDPAAALAELEEKLPGLAETLEPQHPGMHTTDTVDFDVVVSGEICLELDDGKEVLLKAGDCVVQNGTRHAWRNRSSQNCVIAVTLIGAKR
jgi:mannose-6-phosphate isomerase-like protein (cupin superfamily)